MDPLFEPLAWDARKQVPLLMSIHWWMFPYLILATYYLLLLYLLLTTYYLLHTTYYTLLTTYLSVHK